MCRRCTNRLMQLPQLRFLAVFDSIKRCQVWLMYISGEWLLHFFEMERCREDPCETGMPVLCPGFLRGKWQIYALRVEHQLFVCLKVAISM